MASEHNRIRKKWQDRGGARASIAEASFFNSFNTMFAESDYSIQAKPKDFQNLYVDVELKPEDLALIYSPESPVSRHGVIPDYVIRNTKTGRKIFVEVKRQDGWVEGGKRSDGRGNAHERSCKFFTPGLLKSLREAGGIPAPALPFWVVFLGDITRDPCRVREVTHWYEGHEDHFFFWRKAPDPDLLFKHFDECISPLIGN